MLFLYDNIVGIQIAALACVFAWLFGGTVSDALVPVIPWMLFILVELMFCFPQRYSGESTYEARERVWGALKRDPLTWVVVGFLLLLMIPFVNKGLCPVCDYVAIEFQGADPNPPVRFLPFCVNRMHHLNVVIWFASALTAMLATKHALVKRGKRTMLELIVWNGAILGVLGAVQQLTDAKGPLWLLEMPKNIYFFSTFGMPNVGGDYFTTLFGLSVGLWRWRVEEARKEASGETDADSIVATAHAVFWRKHLLLIPVVINFFAAMMTLCRAAILFSILLAVIFFVHTFVCFFSRMSRPQRVKAGAAVLISLVVILVGATAFSPASFQKELSSVDTIGFLNRATGKGSYQTDVAVKVWREHPLFGCGGWGYRHFSLTKMDESELKIFSYPGTSGGAMNVHNDYLQFLTEHGSVGLALLLSVFVMLLWPLGRVWHAMMASLRFVPPKDQPPPPAGIFIIPAPVFCILMTTVTTVLHGLCDCPFRSPAVMTLFFVSLASMDGFMPHVKER